MRKQDIKAILFDFDGTLINSIEVYRDMLLALGSKYGGQVTQGDFLRINGMHNREAILFLLQKRKMRKRALLNLFFRQGTYRRRLAEETQAYPHAHQCLIRLSPRYRLAIVTSSKRSHVEHFALKFGFASFIEAIVSQESIKNKKPDPAPYLKAAQILRVHPSSCLVIEDSLQGVLSGKRANMRTCAVLHTTPRSYFVGEFAPDQFIEHLGELTTDWLQQIGGS